MVIMIKRNSSRCNKGFALVFTILLLVGLQVAIGGAFVNMMRHEREVSRIVHRTQINWAREATVERAIKLFSDYIRTTDEFPNTGAQTPDGKKIVLGDQSQTVTGNKTFSDYLTNVWYSQFRSRFPNDLNQIGLANVTINQTQDLGVERRYEIIVKIQHSLTQLTTTATQVITARKGRLFDYSVFYNDDLEIAGGPNFTLQGPVFSNKNIYLMNDKGSTLTLVRADDFAAPDNHEPYVLYSAGNIYFFHKQMMGKNYLLMMNSGNNAYRTAIQEGSLPPYYETDNPTVYPPADGAETIPNSGIKSPPTPGDPDGASWWQAPFPPFFYHIDNGTRLASTTYDNYPEFRNTIVAEDDAGNLVQLIPSHTDPAGVYAAVQGSNIGGLTYTTSYSSNTVMSMSTAFDPNHFPRLAFNWTPENPVSSSPMRNPNWFGVSTTVLDQQPKRDVTIGDPTEDPHTLIEPLTSLFPPGGRGTLATRADSPELQAVKLQGQANLNLYCQLPCSSASDYSSDLQRLIAVGVVTVGLAPYDYRIGTVGKQNVGWQVVNIDVSRLLTLPETQDTNGLVLYVHVYELDNYNYQTAPRFVRLLNGEKLPRYGLTVATNGRLWIQGNYNKFDYTKSRGSGDFCVERDWDRDHTSCVFPPAAIFSDSFGILSNDWTDTSASCPRSGNPPCDVAQRPVFNDVMVNAAISTGYIPTQLVKTGAANCPSNMSGCESTGSPGRPFDRFQCPGGLHSDGTPVDMQACEYYKGSGATTGLFPGTKGVWYLNKQSDLFLQAQSVRPTLGQNYSKIPIVAAGEEIYFGYPWPSGTEPRGVRDFYYGVNRAFLQRSKLLPSTSCSCILVKAGSCGSSGDCSNARVGCPNDASGVSCPANVECIYNEAEATTPPSCGNCKPECYTSPVYDCSRCSTVFSPSLSYRGSLNAYMGDYTALYETRYSGGLESLINLQEYWPSDKVLRFSGTMTAPWEALELRNYTGGSNWEPAFYSRSYYLAPTRIYDYDESLKTTPPPDTPGVFSIERKEWRGN